MKGEIISNNVTGKFIRRSAIVLAAWLPLYVFWVLSAMSISHEKLSAVLVPCLITIGSGGLLGILVWRVCRIYPWPARFSLRF